MHEDTENRIISWGIKLAAVEFCYYFAMAGYSYLSTYLDSLGYTVTQVGLITTIISIVAMISTPLMGTLGDKLKSSSKAAIICMIGVAISCILTPLSAPIKVYGFSIMLLFVVIARFFYGPCGSLMETTVITGCNKTNTDFGKVRTFGSISWIIMSFILGKTISSSNSYLTFYILAAALIPCIFFILSIRPITEYNGQKEKVSLKNLPYGKLLKNPYFLFFILFAVCRSLPLSASTTYLPYLIKEAGGDMGKIGLIQAYRSSFEFPILFFSGKIMKKISLRNMFTISVCMIATTALLYGFVSTFTGIILATTFAGLSLGFANSAAYRYVFTMAPKQLRSTAQTIYGSCLQISSILSGFIGTALVAGIGVKMYFTLNGGFCFIAVALYLFGVNYVANIKKIPFIDYAEEERREINN